MKVRNKSAENATASKRKYVRQPYLKLPLARASGIAVAKRKHAKSVCPYTIYEYYIYKPAVEGLQRGSTPIAAKVSL